MPPPRGQPLTIQPVRSRGDWNAFIRLPWRVNRDDPHWVPPLVRDRRRVLDSERNPFFKHNPAEFFLARREQEPVGRIASIVNKGHNRFHQDRAGFFGFMDAVNEREVFQALFDAAEDWLRGQGCDQMIGPVSPDTNNELGVLIDGFDSPPYFMLAHNPPYYAEIMNELGLAKARDFHSYLVSGESFVAKGKLERVNAKVRDRYPVTLRPGDLSRYAAELELIRDIYNDAFATHWGFVPMTREELQFFAEDLRLILDPELVLFLEYETEPAAFLLALPNINEVLIRIRDGRLFPFGWLRFLLDRRHIQSIRVPAVAVRQRYQAFGFGGLLYEEIAKRILARGYRYAEMSWIMEDNLMMNRAARLLGGKVVKTYRLYQKELI